MLLHFAVAFLNLLGSALAGLFALELLRVFAFVLVRIAAHYTPPFLLAVFLPENLQKRRLYD